MRRQDLVEFLSDAIRFGAVVASKLGSNKSAELQLDESPRADVELWGHAPLTYKPLAGTETLCVQLGDENVVFATKDRRWQLELADGEVMLRGMGANGAFVHLKPDGTCIVQATNAVLKASSIKLGADTASDLIALAPKVAAEFAKVWKAIEGHVHGVVGANTTPPSGVAPTPPPAPGWWNTGVAVTTAGSVASSKVRAE